MRFPRLRFVDAQNLAEELATNPSGIVPSISHPNQYHAPVGGPRVPTARLEQVRQAVLEAHAKAREDHDALGTQGGRISWPKRFDLTVGRALHTTLGMSRSEAAVDGVWSWLSLVLLPDIALQRWSDAPAKRVMGGPRNLFSVAWWPMEVLGESLDPSNPDALGVDELVGLFERPTLSREPELARRYTELLQARDAAGRPDISRLFAKGVRRAGSHTLWPIAEPSRLEGLLAAAIKARESAEVTSDAPDEPSDGPIEAAVRFGSLEVEFSIPRSHGHLQPRGTLDWTSVPRPAASDPPGHLRVEGHLLPLEANGNTRRRHPRFICDGLLETGVRVRATVLQRPKDLYVTCSLDA